MRSVGNRSKGGSVDKGRPDWRERGRELLDGVRVIVESGTALAMCTERRSESAPFGDATIGQHPDSGVLSIPRDRVAPPSRPASAASATHSDAQAMNAQRKQAGNNAAIVRFNGKRFVNIFGSITIPSLLCPIRREFLYPQAATKPSND